MTRINGTNICDRCGCINYNLTISVFKGGGALCPECFRKEAAHPKAMEWRELYNKSIDELSKTIMEGAPRGSFRDVPRFPLPDDLKGPRN